MTRIQTSTPHRVDLPELRYLAKPVAAAATRYADLDRRYHAQVAAVQTAMAAVSEAVLVDAQEGAAALAGGATTVTKPRARTTAAEAALDDAKALRDAYEVAVRTAYADLRDEMVSAAPAWAKRVEAEHAEAVGRYEAALASLVTSERDVVATGSILSMLREAPAALVARGYKPEAQLSIATEHAGLAVNVVKTHEAAARGPVEAS